MMQYVFLKRLVATVQTNIYISSMHLTNLFYSNTKIYVAHFMSLIKAEVFVMLIPIDTTKQTKYIRSYVYIYIIQGRIQGRVIGVR